MTMNHTSDVTTTQMTTAMTMMPAVVVLSLDEVVSPLSLTMCSSAVTTNSRQVCNSIAQFNRPITTQLQLTARNQTLAELYYCNMVE